VSDFRDFGGDCGDGVIGKAGGHRTARWTSYTPVDLVFETPNRVGDEDGETREWR